MCAFKGKLSTIHFSPSQKHLYEAWPWLGIGCIKKGDVGSLPYSFLTKNYSLKWQFPKIALEASKVGFSFPKCPIHDKDCPILSGILFQTNKTHFLWILLHTFGCISSLTIDIWGISIIALLVLLPIWRDEESEEEFRRNLVLLTTLQWALLITLVLILVLFYFGFWKRSTDLVA